MLGDDADDKSVQRLALRSRRVDRTRNIPRIALDLEATSWSVDRDEHVDLVGATIRTFAERTGRDWVIDASKEASHGFLIGRAAGVRLHVLHLVRDARGVAYSWTRARPRRDVGGGQQLMARRSPALTAWRWTYQNLAAESLRSVAHGYARIRYEDVVADPVPTLRHALECLGFPQKPRFDHIEGRTARLSPSHGVAGNPLRFQHDPVELRLDEAWRRELPRPDVARVTAIAGPLLLRYGYGVRA